MNKYALYMVSSSAELRHDEKIVWNCSMMKDPPSDREETAFPLLTNDISEFNTLA